MARSQSAPQRVLVTRAAHGASALGVALEDLGLQPVLLPAIAVVEPSSSAALDHALSALEHFHWLLFTSANAVERFATRYRSQFPEHRLPQALRIAAIGPATARALEALKRTADLIPAQAVAESFAETLLPYAHQPGGGATRFLLPRAEEARDHLPEALRAAGAEVVIVPAYRTILPPESVALTRTLFSEPAQVPDAITFTSASTARNLVALCEAAGVALPETAVRVSIGPVTTEALRDLSLPPHAEAPEANVLSLAQTTHDLLAARGILP